LSRSTEAVAALVAGVSRAPDEIARRDAFAQGFATLRGTLDLHPRGAKPSATFEAAACTACEVAAECLPLGLALVMHLYPLCTLRCVPLPWLSRAHARRARLLRDIDSRGLILANAGSERGMGVHAPVMLTRTSWGLRVDGTYDYVSLANVADLVLFNAPLPADDTTMFCVAALRAGSTHIGDPKFAGSMRLSDTCSLRFDAHLVPSGRHLEVPNHTALSCMAQYQRSWFQLLLGEAYLVRLVRLRETWSISPSTEDIASLNELALMKDYALRLLDESTSPAGIETLGRVTNAMKLRVSWQAQAVAAAVREHDEIAANELGYLRLQPTSDERIVRALWNDRGARYRMETAVACSTALS
jgi:hypothetical protein